MPIGNAFTILKSVKIKVPMVENYININDPHGLAFDSMDNLYCSCETSKINKITPDGTMTNFVNIISGAEPARIANIAIDTFDNVYSTDSITSSFNNFHFAISKTNSFGIFSRYHESGSAVGIYIDKNNNLYYTPWFGECVVKIDSNKNIINAKMGDLTIKEPRDIALDSSENVYVISKHKIYKILKNGLGSLFAGSNTAGNIDGHSTSAQFNTPQGLCFDKNDNLYVADTLNQKIRKITLSGQVTTIAGTGGIGDKDGPALQANFKYPTDVVFKNGIVYISDKGNNKIKKLIL